MGFTDNLFSITNRKEGAAETQEGPVTVPGKRCKKDVWGCKERPQTLVWSCRLSLCCKMMCAQHWAQTTEPASTDSSQPSVWFSYHAEQDGGTQPGSQSAQKRMGTAPPSVSNPAAHPKGTVAEGLVPRKQQLQFNYLVSVCLWFGASFAHRK